MELLKTILVSVARVTYFFLVLANVMLLVFFVPIWSELKDFPWGSKEVENYACFASLDAYRLCCYQNILLIALPFVVSLIVCRKYPKISLVLMALPIVLSIGRMLL